MKPNAVSPGVPPQAVALVPEIEVSDFPRSLRFYVTVLGFSVLYDRPERPFAYLTLGAAHIMIEHGGRCATTVSALKLWECRWSGASPRWAMDDTCLPAA